MALEVNLKSVRLTALMNVQDAIVHIRLYPGLIQHALSKHTSGSGLPYQIYAATPFSPNMC